MTQLARSLLPAIQNARTQRSALLVATLFGSISGVQGCAGNDAKTSDGAVVPSPTPTVPATPSDTSTTAQPSVSTPGSATGGGGTGNSSAAGGSGGMVVGSAGGAGGLGAGGSSNAGGSINGEGGTNAGGGGSAASGGSGGMVAAGGAGSSWEGCDEFALPADCTIPEGAVLPGELRCTGLYSNFEQRALRCGVTEYAPAYELWADGAAKQRYVWLPPGQKVDVSNPDEFAYPVGTRFWKEFHVGPEGSQRLGETRYLLKTDAGWLYTVYVWDEAGTTALQNNDGVADLFGTGHSVPSREQCKTCHVGRQNFILGWDFIMLGEGATGITAKDLAAEDKLDGLDPAWLDLTLPGDSVEQQALTYLHANCGVSCHNTGLDTTANPSGLYLRLEVGALDSVQATNTFGAVNRPPAPNAKFDGLPLTGDMYYDIRPGDPERSLMFARMLLRDSETAMPPIGTHVIDDAGTATVRAWIESMTEERGYPPAEP